MQPTPFQKGLSELADGLKILGIYFLWPFILVISTALSLWPVWLVGLVGWYVWNLP